MGIFDDWGEKIAEILSGGIEGLAMAAWFFIEDAFRVGTVSSEAGDGALSDWWVAVVGGEITQVSTDGEVLSTVDHPGMLAVVTAVMVPVLMIIVGIQVVLSIFRGSTAGLLRGALVAIGGIPAVVIMTGLMWMLLGAADLATSHILNAGTSQNDGVVAVLSMFGLQWDESGTNTSDGEAGVVLNEAFVQWEMARDEQDVGRALFPLIVAGALLIAGVILMGMMVLRVLALLILTVFLPVAIFSLASEASKPIFNRWWGVVIALLAAKPAAAVVIRFGAVMAQASSEFIMMAIGFVLLLVAAAAPLILLPLMGWMTGGASDGIERAGAGVAGRAVNQTKSTTRNAVRGASRRASSAVRPSAGRSGGGTVKAVGGGSGGGGTGGGGAAKSATKSSGGGSTGGGGAAKSATKTSGGGSGGGAAKPATNTSGGGQKTATGGSRTAGSGASGTSATQVSSGLSTTKEAKPAYGGAAKGSSTSAGASAQKDSGSGGTARPAGGAAQ